MTTFIRRPRLRRVRIFIMKAAGTVCRCGLGVRTTGGMHRRRAFIGIIRRRAVIIAKKAEAAAIRDVLAAVPSVSTAVRPIGSLDWVCLPFVLGLKMKKGRLKTCLLGFQTAFCYYSYCFLERFVCRQPVNGADDAHRQQVKQPGLRAAGLGFQCLHADEDVGNH